MLHEYKRKRNFSKTSEPKAAVKTKKRAKQLIFVVQKHSASHLHYDFRLEVGGVLVSWAVPKGPSLDPKQKRLAVHVEDHPYAYKDFEGVIPKGQYGAGEVVIWDQGTYEPDGNKGSLSDEESIKKGLKNGKLDFVLKGEKLKGKWTLVRFKTDKEWLLIKKGDQFATGGNVTVEKRKPAPVKGKKTTFPKLFAPMLAKLVRTPFAKADWIFEPKLDGIRALSYIQNGKVSMLSRRGLNLNHRYPSINKELAAMDERMILDGEIVALDQEGRPSFQLLQQYDELSITAAQKIQIIYYVFDILYYKDRDLRQLPLNERQRILRQALSPGKNVKIVESLNCDGKQAFQICLNKGLEGIVAKYSQGIYESGRRSDNWLKVKVTQSAEFIICGYNPGIGARKSTFGSLLLGYYDKSGNLVYAGNVGTGFNVKLLDKLKKLMKPLERKTSPFNEKIPNSRSVIWLTPQLVAEIKYAEITQDQKLRVPVFMRLREDINLDQTGPTPAVKAVAQNVEEPQADESIRTHLVAQAENINLLVDGNSIKITHLDKILWPGNAKTGPLTKRDYLLYLLDVAPVLLPHLKDRPITLIRYPNGLRGQRFFQKHWNQNLPSFVDTVEYYSEHNDTDEQYLICNNLSTLLWLGQMSTLELHTAHSRINPEPDATQLPKKMTGSEAAIEASVLNHPDFIVFDLDPYVYSGKEAKGAEPELNIKGFAKVKKVAFWLKEILDQIGIKSYLKTSGRTGLHIYIPIVRNVEYERIRAVARILGEYLVSAHGADVTVEWAVAKRPGKIFFDYNMNARGKTLACPYSPRSTAEACVSAPIEWDELNDIYPDDFTIKNMPERIAEKGDLWADILDSKNDLHTLLSGKKMNILNLVPKRN